MNNIFKKILKKSRGRKNAQGMVEFALVLPVLLLMILGIIEFSRLMFAWIIIENSTRFGIRYATTGNFESQYCVDTDDKDDLNGDGTLEADDGNATTGACSGVKANEEIDVARVPSIKDETRRIVVGFSLRKTLQFLQHRLTLNQRKIILRSWSVPSEADDILLQVSWGNPCMQSVTMAPKMLLTRVSECMFQQTITLPSSYCRF